MRKDPRMSATSMTAPNAPSFIHLDMARGLAALLVIFSHLRSFVFVPYGEIKDF